MAFTYKKDIDNKDVSRVLGQAYEANKQPADFPPTEARLTVTSSVFYTDAFNWEPKYQNRFVLEIDDIPAYLIKASSKPQLENGEIVLDHINIQRKVKGKSKWQNITISLYDPIVPSAAQSVIEWVRLHHESATGRDGYSDIYKKNIKLKGLSGPGEVIEEWTLEGAFIQSCNWGSYDWSAEEVVTIEMTLSYDYAFLHY